MAQATQAELQDLVNTRTAIESLVIAQACERRTPAWEEQLVVAFHRLSRTPRSVTPDSYEENPEWERQHREFHRALLAGCGSVLLLDFCDQLYDRAYRFRQLAARSAYKRRNELDEHQAIFEAILNGRADEATALLAAHYRRTARIFEQGAWGCALNRAYRRRQDAPQRIGSAVTHQSPCASFSPGGLQAPRTAIESQALISCDA